MVTNVYIVLSWAATATGSGVLKWKLSTCFRNIFFAPGPHHLLLDSEKFSQGKKCSKVQPGLSCDNQGFWLLLPLPCMHGPLAPCSNGAMSFTAQHLGIYQAGKFGHGLVMVWFLAKSAPQSVIFCWNGALNGKGLGLLSSPICVESSMHASYHQTFILTEMVDILARHGEIVLLFKGRGSRNERGSWIEKVKDQ